MYAVIFKATMAELDSQYLTMAKKLRDKAKEHGCIDFISVSEGDQEIAISYWPDQQSIAAWKKDALHLEAQKAGANKWYKDYQVEVTEVVRAYKKEGTI